MSTDQVFVTLLTPPGRAAVAALQVDGDVAVLDKIDANWNNTQPLFQAANGQPVCAQSLQRIVFGWWGATAPEEVVLCRTGPTRTEIHCHGGASAAARLIGDLAHYGATERFAFETLDEPFDRHAAIALSRAPTLRTAAIIHAQIPLWKAAIATGEAVQADARWAHFGRHLTEPYKVVLCGLPNAGKSSLMNALVGDTRSIVFDQPGTTRDALTSITAFDGWPIELVDTAGLRSSDDSLEQAGIRKAQEHATSADLIVCVVDGSAPVDAATIATVARQIPTLAPKLWVLNKSDLRQSSRPEFSPDVTISALTGAGVRQLIERIVQTLIPELPTEGTLIAW